MKNLTHLADNLSYAISVETSIISNFLLNDVFTFADRRSGKAAAFGGRLLKFNLISLPGWGLNQGTFFVLHTVLGVYYLLASLVGIALATLWNYFANRRWTWR